MIRFLLLLTLLVLALDHTTVLAQTKPPALGPSLRDRAEAAVGKEDYTEGRRLYELWLDADPRDESAWYNLACIYALTGERALALEALERSVEAGWSNPNHPATDPDLESIRADPRFAAAMERIRARDARRAPRGFVRHYAPMTSRGTYIVMLPPDYETSNVEYPICVILHGAGSAETAHGRVADTIGREGVIYVAPRAPYPHPEVFATGERGWTSVHPDGIDPKDSNAAQIVPDYVRWVLTCVEEVQRTYRARKGRFFVYGHSQGGNLANVVALLHPDRVASYYAQAPSLPNARYLTVENARRLKEQGVRAYLIHGAEDTVVPLASSQRIDTVLADAGVDRRLRVVTGDHGYNAVIIEDIRAWLDREVR